MSRGDGQVSRTGGKPSVQGPHMEIISMVEKVQRRCTKVGSLSGLSCMERLNELCLHIVKDLTSILLIP